MCRRLRYKITFLVAGFARSRDVIGTTLAFNDDVHGLVKAMLFFLDLLYHLITEVS